MTIYTATARLGDRIKFRVATRDSNRAATRKVVGRRMDGGYEVRYRGYSDFIVHPHEVLTIYRDAETIATRIVAAALAITTISAAADAQAQLRRPCAVYCTMDGSTTNTFDPTTPADHGWTWGAPQDWGRPPVPAYNEMPFWHPADPFSR